MIEGQAGGMLDCVCGAGLAEDMTKMQNADKEGGICADAPKDADGETDACKLDASSECAKEMGGILKKIRDNAACESMVEMLEGGMTEEEKKCMADMEEAVADASASDSGGADSAFGLRATAPGLLLLLGVASLFHRA